MAKYYYKARNYQWKRYIRIAGVGCVLGGFGVFIYFFFPMVAYQLFLGTPVQKQEIQSPVPKYLVGNNNTVKDLIHQGISRLQFDYTDARNWYPQVQAEQEGVKQPEKINVNKALLKSGADIIEMNTVRKHLSLVKGGGLAKALYPATVASVIFG